MDLIGILNTSEFVNGGMSPAKVSLRWSVKDFDASSWTRGQNFVSSLYLHPYFVYISNKVSKGAKIRNRYNQVPHLTQDTNGKVTNSQ